MTDDDEGVVFANPAAGPAATTADELAERFAPSTIVPVEPEDLEEAIRRAVATGAPAFVAVAGGDGTLRAAAQQLAGGSVPLLPVPAGTRNHFAGTLGIDDLDGAAAAAADGDHVQVDLGDVNGTRFLNNASLGAYARAVRRRESLQRRWPKRIAHPVSIWRELRRGRPLVVTIDGRRQSVWLVFVGNGLYGEGLVDLIGRTKLDEHVLDVRILHAHGRASRLRIIGAALFGRLAHTPLVERRQVDTFELDLAGPDNEVAVDGELVTLGPQLTFTVRPAELLVRVAASGAGSEGDGP